MIKNEPDFQPPNRVAETLKDKTLLITGGTGVVGKLVVEKILRTCPDVRRIYLLIRTKKGKTAQIRIKQLFTEPIYNLLKKTQGEDILDKVAAIPGDVSECDLGLSLENRQLLTAEVEIIIHLAATVRFDEPLSKAILFNTRGTKLMLDLARECSKLQVFNYCSTAYCHLGERVLYEKIYPPPIDPQGIIKIVELLDEKIVTSITDKLMNDDFPNTYVFSKALAESLVADEIGNLPVIILRLCIVIPVWKEPLPGWTDNLNGPTGLLLAAGKGVLRTMYCNPKGHAELMPADIAANAVITTSYDYISYKARHIYNITCSFEVKITWAELINTGRKILETRMPLGGVVWYPGGSLKSSKLLHNICEILFHCIPAIIVDTAIFVSGNKPVLWRVQKRISNGAKMLEYFANNQWDFNIKEAITGRELLNSTERTIYKLDSKGFNLEEYLYDCIHAMRLYMLKQGDETLPAHRKHMKMLWILDKLCKTLILIGIGFLVFWCIIRPAVGLDI